MGPDGWIDNALKTFPFHSPVLQAIGDALNRIGKGDALAFLCILLVLAGYVWGRSRWIRAGGLGIVTVALSGLIVQIIKHLFGRARPQMNLGDLHFIGPNLLKNGFESFPSGHATSGFAIAAFMSAYFPNLSPVFYGLAAAIALIGRVMFRYHFFSDVCAGAALGFAIGYFMARESRRFVEGGADAPPLFPAGPAHAIPPAQDIPIGTFRCVAAIVILSGTLLFSGLSRAALWDRDETEYAQAVIEMQQSNEWLIPTLAGKPFIEKPILMYWFVRASHLAFGTNEFAFRFPSAVFGVLACLATYGLGWVLWGSLAGLLSALALGTSLLFLGGFTLLLTDPFFVFFNILAFLFYALFWKSERRSPPWLALSYAATGLAVLAKGPIALYPVGVFLLFEWSAEEEPAWKALLRHGLFSLISIAIAAPWFLYCFSKQAQATESFFLMENVMRFLRGSEGHTGPLFYYVVVALLGFFPWSFFIFPWVRKQWKARVYAQDGGDPWTWLLTLWALVLFVFFSLSANKLPHYFLPALPALACLMGKFWEEQILESPVETRASFNLLVATALLLALAPSALYHFRPAYASLRLSLPFFIFSLTLLPALWLAFKDEWQTSFLALCLAMLLLGLNVSTVALPWIDSFRVMKPIGLALKAQDQPDTRVVGYHVSEPSLFIYGGRVFPKIEAEPLDSILAAKERTLVVVEESRLKNEKVERPYRVLERKDGFAENGGELTLLLIENHP